ncbi:MAG: hypothetical protein R2724_27265 [Bryobacterales bacterium]
MPISGGVDPPLKYKPTINAEIGFWTTEQRIRQITELASINTSTRRLCYDIEVIWGQPMFFLGTRQELRSTFEHITCISTHRSTCRPMTSQKPSNSMPSGPSTFKKIDLTANSTKQIQTNVQSAQNAIQDSSFMHSCQNFCREEPEYFETTGTQLLMASEISVEKKPFASAVEKSFRFNVLRNKRFPDPPARWLDNRRQLVRAV